jgi:hypothetical protein
MRTSPISGSILPVAAAALLTACATTFGTQFARPPADFVHLGETTQAQIVERLGKPQREEQHRSDGQLLRSIYYYFGSETEPPKDSDTVCFRRLIFVLSDDIVIHEAFTSTCAADHTDFDERKAGDIVKGKTRCDEVIAMMGRPNTRAIYPSADKKGELSIGYAYRDIGRLWGPRKNYSKELKFLCDSEGMVRDMSFQEFGSR